MTDQNSPRSDSEQKPPEDSGSPQTPSSPLRGRFGFLYILIGFVLLLSVVQMVQESGTKEATYDEFLRLVDLGYVQWVILGEDEHIGRAVIPPDAPPFNGEPAAATGGASEPGAPEAGAPGTGTQATRPGDTVHPTRDKDPKIGGKLPDRGDFKFRCVAALKDDQLIPKLEAARDGFGTKFQIKTRSGWSSLLLIYLLPFLLIIGFWFFIMRQSGQMGKAALSFGKSRAKLYAEKLQTVTFDDVAGCEEAKTELSEVVDFLKHPRKYQRLGARIPKGMLLVGPPGTGKTLLARAVAGEAKTPFFSLSGSDFVEMFVGVGASRVRDLFEQGKKKAPCIIFIDELDAVGRHRGAGLGGGHDEREQTLNQLLVEMDGFDTTKGVILLAATNRPDVLDPALLRPGRFDRQVVIDAPDARGRKAILEVHAKNKPFDESIDFELLAANTPGFTGADLANVINEAALLAARKDRDVIGQEELDEAVERAIAGPERKSRRLGDEERRRVAYHEAGHALVATLSEHADPVRKISIVPRGHAALGYTMQSPTDDRYLITRSALIDRLKGLLAGRAAEELVFDELSTGASDDLKRATKMARSMVCRFGMSEKLGPVTFGEDHQPVFLGRSMNQEERNYSDTSAREIDEEVRSIIESANAAAKAILADNRDCLTNIAERLLEREVIQGGELEEMLKEELCAKGKK